MAGEGHEASDPDRLARLRISAETDFADIAIVLLPFASSGDRCRLQTNSQPISAPRPDQHGPGAHWSDLCRPLASERNRKLAGISAWSSSASTTRPSSCGLTCDPNDQLQLIWLLDYLQLSSGHRGQVEIASCRLRDDRALLERTWQVAAAARRRHREGSGDGKHGLAGVSGADAGSLLRSARQGFERFAAAQAGLARSARRASVRRDGAWRDGNADAGADREGILRIVESALSSSATFARRRVFGELELGYLLDGLALGPRPAIAGLDDELRTIEPGKPAGPARAHASEADCR